MNRSGIVPERNVHDVSARAHCLDGEVERRLDASAVEHNICTLVICRFEGLRDNILSARVECGRSLMRFSHLTAFSGRLGDANPSSATGPSSSP